LKKDKKIFKKLKSFLDSKLKTPSGEAILKEIYITELGYVMAKVYFIDRKVYINYVLASMKDLLSLENLHLLNDWSDRIIIKENFDI
jgi:hypothetical protein